MRYLAKILNEYGFFLRLHSEMRDAKENQGFVIKAEHFLYNASCVLKSLERMYAAESSTVGLVRGYLNQLTFGSDKKFVVAAEPLFEVYSQIPGALGQLVIMQNQLLPLLQAIYKIKGSVPSSLKDAVGSGLEKYGFSKELNGLVQEYWNSGGKYIRNVRDLNEHFVALVDYSFFKYESDPGQIVVFFPDNPETKSPAKFTYELENDAYETIASGIQALSSLLDCVLQKKGVAPSAFTNAILMSPMGDLTKEQERTLGLMIDITKVEQKGNERTIHCDTIEMKQVVPKDGKGNITVGKLKPDSEVGGATDGT